MHRPKLPKPLHPPASAGQTQSKNHVPFTNLSPQTSAEHYWASRALKAEALLSAREKHFEEVGRVREGEEIKRREELLNLETRYKEKYNNQTSLDKSRLRLEKLVTALILAMAFLLGLLTYVVVSNNHHNSFNSANAPGFPFLSFLWSWSGSSYLNRKIPDSSRFNFHLHLPSHFTVPILSPWASVVENQTSNTIGTSTSSSFYNILIISFLCIGIASLIIWKYNRGPLRHLGEKHTDNPELLPSNSISQFLGSVLNPGLSWITFWMWAWNWTCKLLRLIGFAPR